MTYSMASIISKKVDGRTYYYLREMARVNGKPKMISERYLGKASDIEAAMNNALGVPERTRHLGFGDLAAVWVMLERLDVASIVDDVLGPRRGDAAASVGTYIALIIANRVVEPRSKLGFADWWSKTAGDRFVKIPSSGLDHRRFWDAMDEISTEDLVEIERRVFGAMVKTFDLDMSALVLDMTNFATFIDSGNERNEIAQRGKAKQKRYDLRLVGLGLVVTRDGGIPIASHTYAGNRHDSTQFPLMVKELSRRYGVMSPTSDINVVYDAGQNSAANQAAIEATQLHFVGSAPPSEHPDLLSVPKDRYGMIDEEQFAGVCGFETTAVVLGLKRRVVMTHSEEFHQAQARGFDQTINKAVTALQTVADRLARGNTRKARAAVVREVTAICAPRWVSRVITTTLTGKTPKTFRLSWTIDDSERKTLEDEIFGKRVLFTDRTDWSIAEVVSAYRSQADVEAGFRQMKDPRVVGVSPMHHWTDSKIRVQMLCCVLALTVAHLMRREVAKRGLDMSVRVLLDNLAGVQETVLIYPSTGGRPRARRMLTDMDSTQRQLFDLFGLKALAPKG